jgi:choline kinase
MNVIILGDKYEKGKKSQGAQALLNYKGDTKYIDYYNKTIEEYFPKSNITYVYGLGDRKFLSYYENHKKLKKISIVHNLSYDNKNEVYSVSLCQNNIMLNQSTLIINGNLSIQKNIVKKILRNKNSCVFFAKQNLSRNIGCVYGSGKVLNLSYGLNTTIDNMYYISKTDQETWIGLIRESSNHNKFIFEIFNIMIDKQILINLI